MPNQLITDRILSYVENLASLNVEVVRDGLQLIWKHREIEMLAEKYLGTQGLLPRQFETVEILYHHPDHFMTPAELANEVNLTRSAMTSNLDSLERQGYLCRDKHPDDRRMIKVSLTQKGMSFCEENFPRRYRDMVRIIGSLSRAERQVVLEAYTKLSQVFSEMLKETVE